MYVTDLAQSGGGRLASSVSLWADGHSPFHSLQVHLQLQSQGAMSVPAKLSTALMADHLD